MADQQTNQMLSLDQLGKNARDNLLKAGQEGESALKRELSRQNVSPEFWTEATKIFLTPSASPQSLPGDSFAKNTIGALGASALAMATRDTSGSSEIMGEVNNKHLDELLSNDGPLHDALARGDMKALKENLDMLDPDKLIDRQYELLENNIRKEMGDKPDEEAIDKLRKQHLDQVVEAKELRKKDLKKEKRRLDTQDKMQKNLIKKIGEAKEIDKKRALLLNYLRYQQQGNYNHFYNLLSEKRGLGRKSTLQEETKRRLVKSARETDRQRRVRLNEEIKSKKFKKNLFSSDGEESPPENAFDETEQHYSSYLGRQVLPQEHAYSGVENQPLQAPSQPYNPSRSPISQAASAQRTLSVLGKIPWPWTATILGVLALVSFIIIVVVLLINGGGSVPIAQIRCGNQDIASVPNITGTLLEKIMHDDYRINMKGDSKNADASNTIEGGLFNAVCILFSPPNGFKSGTPGFLQPYSMFGNLVVGFPGQRDDRSQTKSLEIDLKFGVKGKGCDYEIKDPKQLTSGDKLVWNFNNPDTCSDAQLQFNTGEMLGYTLIIQQGHIQKNDNVGEYKAFTSIPDTTGVIGQDGLLPTPNCSTGASYAGQDLPDQQQRDCFADSVGLYLTYGLSDIDTVATPSAINFPIKYPNYYLFSKNNLFDGREFFVTPATSSAGEEQTAPYAIKLVNDIQTACANKLNSGYVYGHYFVAVTVNDINCLKYPILTSFYPSSVINTLYSSTRDFTTLQCIGFAQAVSDGVDGPKDTIHNCLIYLPGWNSVDNRGKSLKPSIICPQGSPYSYVPKTTSQFTLLPGDYALWRFSDWGHIAAVTSVQPTVKGDSTSPTYSYVVAEANGGNGYVDISTTYQVDSNLIGVLRHN